MNKKNIMWGAFFLLAAVVVIVSKLGLIGGISIFTILLTILFAGVLISGIVKVEFGSILFSVAFLCILYDKQLGIEALTPWTVLGAALLGTIGLNMIFQKHHHSHINGDGSWGGKNHAKGFNTDVEFDKIINEPDAGMIRCEAKFSGTVKYVNTDCFERADIACSFGAVKMYFDNATLKGENGLVHVDCNFGGVELFFPKTWNVVCDVDTSFAGVEEKNKSAALPDAPTIRVSGSLSFAGLTIWYV